MRTSTPSLRPLVTAMTDVPMGAWKRLAVYPVLWWFLLGMFLPCRLHAMSGLSVFALFALSAVGVIGALVRLVAEPAAPRE